MYISRTSEVCGSNWCGMLLAFPDIAHDKFGGNLLIFDQLVVALYSLSSFSSASSSTFSATEYFNGQWAGVGSMLSFSDVFYPVSGCSWVWCVAQGTLRAMSHCQATSMELRRARWCHSPSLGCFTSSHSPVGWVMVCCHTSPSFQRSTLREIVPTV